MKAWTELEGYNNGATFSRFTNSFFEIKDETLVLCTFPRLFTEHCTNELKAADDIYQQYQYAGIPIVFASTDSPEVAERFFGENPVQFPFVKINRRMDYDLGLTDRFGDALRQTSFIKDGRMIDCDVTAFDSERDFWDILQKAKKVLL